MLIFLEFINTTPYNCQAVCVLADRFQSIR